MYNGFKIVCVTPAGRRRYMRLLAPQILASPLVDRYDVWVNTANKPDLDFFEALRRLDKRVNLVAQPDGKVKGVSTIGAFHRHATDEDTIYIRLDDDIVWLQPDFFERHLAFRIANPGYLLTMPLVVNNAVCTALLQETGKIRLSRRVGIRAFDPIGWRDGTFAVALHRLFLGLVETKQWSRLWGGNYPIGLNRFCINCICWFGKDLAAYPDMIGRDEEQDWTVKSGFRTGRVNCFATDSIVAHYAFYSQRAHLDRTDLLDRYRRTLMQRPEVAASLKALEDLAAGLETAGGGGADGGEAPRQPGVRERLKVWSRKYRGREATVELI